MKYSEFIEQNSNMSLMDKNFLLLQNGLFELIDVEKLPVLEVLGNKKGLVFFKSNDGYGFYYEKIENGKVFGYDIYRIESLTDDEFADVSNSFKKAKFGKMCMVFEIAGWILALVSFIIFLFSTFSIIQRGGNFTDGQLYASSFFVALILSMMLAVYCRIERCKNTF